MHENCNGSSACETLYGQSEDTLMLRLKLPVTQPHTPVTQCGKAVAHTMVINTKLYVYLAIATTIVTILQLAIKDIETVCSS